VFFTTIPSLSFLKIATLFVTIVNRCTICSEPEFTPSAKSSKSKSAKATSKSGKGGKAVYYQMEGQITVAEAEKLQSDISNGIAKSSPHRLALVITTLFFVLVGYVN
jgi:hypothetical protein